MSKPKAKQLANPVENTFSKPNTSNSLSSTPEPSSTSDSTASPVPHPNPVSSDTYLIAGMQVIVYGLSSLPPTTTETAVLWLLHPRLVSQSYMAPFAAHLISEWYQHQTQHPQHHKHNHHSQNKPRKGLIAVSFDQRNHGTRLVSALANEAWRSGNDKHAQDMFGTYHGTATDTSLLLDYLPAYVFPDDRVKITQNLVLGVSLGGHAAWHVVMQDHRFTDAVVVIGCPDYLRLMADRARLSKRRSWFGRSAEAGGYKEGERFVGSEDFPNGLVEVVKRFDPAALVWGTLDRRRKGAEEERDLFDELTREDEERLRPSMTKWFGHKRILNLSGGSDKLVPYARGEPFLKWLRRSIGKGGWFEQGGLYFEDIIVPNTGHEVPPVMVEHMVKFVNESLDGGGREVATASGTSRESRI